MAKGRGDDFADRWWKDRCVGGTGAAPTPFTPPVLALPGSQGQRCWSQGASPEWCSRSAGLALFLSSLALSADISAPDSLVRCRVALRLFHITLGMKYKNTNKSRLRHVPTASVG